MITTTAIASTSRTVPMMPRMKPAERDAAPAELAVRPLDAVQRHLAEDQGHRRGQQADAVGAGQHQRRDAGDHRGRARGRRSAAPRRTGTAAARRRAGRRRATAGDSRLSRLLVGLLRYGGGAPYVAGGGGAPYGWCVGGVPRALLAVRVLGAGRHGRHPVRIRRPASASMSARCRRLSVVGCAGRPHRHPGQLGELGVGELVRGAHRGVLPGQLRPEEQRVVGARARRSRPPPSSVGSGTDVRSE